MTNATRFPLHTPHTATGAAAERLGDLWQRHDGHVSDMVRTMAGSPALLAGYLDLSRAMKRSRLPRRVAEQLSIAIQARLGCGRCLEAHIAAGRAAGLDDEDIALAIHGSARAAADAALVAFGLAIHRDPASTTAETLETLRRHGHSDRDLLDVVGLVTLNHLTGALNLVAGLEPEESMNTTTRLAAYGAVLAASFAGAASIGSAAGPIDTGDTTVTHDAGDHGSPMPTDHGERAGTSLDAAGFRLVPDAATIPPLRAAEYRFRIVDGDGQPVTRFTTRHERDMHLILASRDLGDFHHLHPQQDGGGIWTVELPPLDAGAYRVFADSQPTDADPVTLGVDLFVGEGPLAGAPVTHDEVDGFEVTLSGSPTTGGAALTFTVERHGERVVTEPYLGASGHLVVLRAGDLAYIHAHADDAAADHTIGFDVEFPTPGEYRLFLDFSVDGRVHTADFTVQVAAAGDTTEPAPTHEGH